MAVNGNSGNDTIGLSVEGLSEGQYNFSVFTYDANNNESVVQRAAGTVYGENYMKSLSNRAMSSLEQFAEGNRILIGWSSPLVGEAGFSLVNMEVNGVLRILMVQLPETTK